MYNCFYINNQQVKIIYLIKKKVDVSAFKIFKNIKILIK
jgi:hypothetical protein